MDPVAATFAEHLQGLDDEALASLLTLRREACTEPLPADFSRLADRLCTSPSLVKALCQADRDAMEVARAIVVLGSEADPRSVADLFDAKTDLVDRAVDRLVELGMAWPDGARLRLPDRIVEHFSAGIGGSEEIIRLARAIRVEELKVLAEAHEVATAGLRKPELVTALAEALADRRAVADRISALDARHQRRLLDMLVGEADRYPNHLDNVDRVLVGRGVIVHAGYRMAVPREVAIAAGSWRDATVAAAVDEAVRLGLAEGDGLTPLGRALGSVDAPALAEAAEPHLGDVACQVLLQSDLTAVVTGTPDDAGLGLLSDAADVETRGAATVYRFSPGGIRRALDVGWSAEGLLAGLRSLSGTDLPQPLDYLVRDAARVHGSIRVHDVRTCVVAEESLVEELAHARTLRKLGWRRLTPTVLASAEPPQAALSLLRGAGYSPVLDDGSGAVAVERTDVEPVAPDEPIATSRIDPAEVVRRLRVTPDQADSPTMVSLVQLNGRLSADELDLPAHALDHQEPVHITYRVTSGTVTERAITPTRLMHRWLISWCHLRNDDREFTVSSILAVRPA